MSSGTSSHERHAWPRLSSKTSAILPRSDPLSTISRSLPRRKSLACLDGFYSKKCQRQSSTPSDLEENIQCVPVNIRPPRKSFSAYLEPFTRRASSIQREVKTLFQPSNDYAVLPRPSHSDRTTKRRASELLRRSKSSETGDAIYRSSANLPTYESIGGREGSHPDLRPSRGAAARQAARDFGKVPSARSDSRHDSTVGLLRSLPGDSESGIDISMEKLGIYDPPAYNSVVIQKDPVASLPTELASHVLSFLDASSLMRAELVSRAWHKVASDSCLWRKVFMQMYNVDFPSQTLPLAAGGKGIGKLKTPQQSWKQMYKARQDLTRKWETGDGVAIYLNGHTDSVYCLQFDEDKVITGSRDQTIRVWSVHDGTLLKVIGQPFALEADRREFNSVTTILGNQPVGLRVLERDTQAPDAAIYHTPHYFHTASILCLQYDEEICVTGSSDCSLIVWDIHTWQPIRKLTRHVAGVLDIAFDHDKIISCSKDSTMCIWDRRTGEFLLQLSGHRGPVNAVQLRGNLVVSASGEGCAKLWNLTVSNPGTCTSAASARCVKDFWSKDRGLACVEFSDDTKYILAGGNDKVIYKFSTATGDAVEQLRGHNDLVRSLYLDGANSRVISGSYDLSLRVWDYKTGVETMKFANWATSWMLSAKADYRRIVSTSQDGRGLIIDFGRDVPNCDSLST